MSECIVVFRIPDSSLQTMNNSEGAPIVFGCEQDAENAVSDHPFIEHQQYELLELNV